MGVARKDGELVLAGESGDPGIVDGDGCAGCLQRQPDAGIRAGGLQTNGGKFHEQKVQGQPIDVTLSVARLANPKVEFTKDH